MDRRIVVGVDGSHQSVNALRWAVEEARFRGAALHVVTVWEFPHTAFLSTPGPIMPVEFHDELLRRAKQIQADVLAQGIPDLGMVQLQTHVVEGVPSEVLVEMADGADMLVLGHRGVGGFQGLLLGSIGHQCTQHATCPVVIVRDVEPNGPAH